MTNGGSEVNQFSLPQNISDINTSVSASGLGTITSNGANYIVATTTDVISSGKIMINIYYIAPLNF